MFNKEIKDFSVPNEVKQKIPILRIKSPLKQKKIKHDLNLNPEQTLFIEVQRDRIKEELNGRKVPRLTTLAKWFHESDLVCVGLLAKVNEHINKWKT